MDIKINYNFDDSKKEHPRGERKNKFTTNRVPPHDTPDFDPSSGWPEEGIEKDMERIKNDNPSYEGEPWFISKSFNDEETNKRPIHPKKDYLNPQDTHTGDDHVEIRGVFHPNEKLAHIENPNTDHINYDDDGKIYMDTKNGGHLLGLDKPVPPLNPVKSKKVKKEAFYTIKDETKHIYKENENIMKNNIQEQVNRIKQMMLFKEGMSFKDVKRLTEQEKEGADADFAMADADFAMAASDADAVAVSDADAVAVSDADAFAVSDEVADFGPEKGEVVDGSVEFEIEPAMIDAIEYSKAKEVIDKIESGEYEEEEDYTLTDTSDEPQLRSDEPQDWSDEPQDWSDEPQDWSDEPQDWSEEPEEWSEEPEEWSEEPKEEPKEEPTKEEPTKEVEKLNDINRAYEEIIELQNFMIEYIENDEGTTEDDYYQDLQQEHNQLMDEYAQLKALTVDEYVELKALASDDSIEEPKPEPRAPIDSDLTPLMGSGTYKGNTYELDLSSPDGLGSRYLGEKIGTGKITARGKKDGDVDITFNNVTHAKYGKGKLIANNEGNSENMYLSFISDGQPNEEPTMQWKVPYKVFKTPSTGRSVKPYKAPAAKTPYTAQSYQASSPRLSNAGQFMSPASKVTNADNPFARAGKYNPFGGGGTKLGSLNDLDLQQLISQLQDQLDSDELKKKDQMNESYRKSSRRRRPTYRTRLNEQEEETESTIMKKVKKYSNQLKTFAKDKGVSGNELMNTLTSIGAGTLETLEKVAEPVLKTAGEFLGVLKANNEITDADMQTVDKTINEAIRRKKNVIKLTEADLYKIVDRVLNENKKGKGCAESQGGSGCVKKGSYTDKSGKKYPWHILNNKKGGIWRGCTSRKDCDEILDAYHANS